MAFRSGRSDQKGFDFVLKEIDSNRLYQDKPGGQRYYAHAIIPYEARSGDQPHEISASLRRGLTIKGRVEGPDGQTVIDASLLTTLLIKPTNPFWRGNQQTLVRDGRFEVHGLAPEGTTRVHISTLNTSGGCRSSFLANRLVAS